MNFKPDPKKQVILKFLELFGHRADVTGVRLTPEECRLRGMQCLSKDGLYLVELHVEGELVASASDKSWREAYKILKKEVEKVYPGIEKF